MNGMSAQRFANSIIEIENQMGFNNFGDKTELKTLHASNNPKIAKVFRCNGSLFFVTGSNLMVAASVIRNGIV